MASCPILAELHAGAMSILIAMLLKVDPMKGVWILALLPLESSSNFRKSLTSSQLPNLPAAVVSFFN